MMNDENVDNINDDNQPKLDVIKPGRKVALVSDECEVFNVCLNKEFDVKTILTTQIYNNVTLDNDINHDSGKLNYGDLETTDAVNEIKHKQIIQSPASSISPQAVYNNDTKNNANIYYLDNVLTITECEKLCRAIDHHDQLSFWNTDALGRENEEARNFRNADTIEIHSPYFAEILWNRIKHIFNDTCNDDKDDDDDDDDDRDNEKKYKMNDDDDDDDNYYNIDDKYNIIISDNNENNINYERELIGKWKPTGINHDLLFAKYPCNGSFAPHTDGHVIENFNYRSFYSIILFLNTIPALSYGGSTRFYNYNAIKNLKLIKINDIIQQWTCDNKYITHEIEAKAGRMLIFHQSLVHEGVLTVTPYNKYIIRTDIMYQRYPSLCNSVIDQNAYTLFKNAEDLAENGDVVNSILLFRKAFKMSPTMAAIMGHS
jgi:hypothetical protein